MSLFEEFKPISKAEWFSKIEKDLKGKPISDLIIDIGGINISPFYHAEEAMNRPAPIPQQAGWEIGEDVLVNDDLRNANKKLLAALEAGVNAPGLVLNNNITARDLDILLGQIDLTSISIHFYFAANYPRPLGLLSHFIQFITDNSLPPEKIRASFNWGDHHLGTNEIKDILSQVKNLKSNLSVLPVNGLDDVLEKNLVKELVEILRKGESYLQQHLSENTSPGLINKHIMFSISIGKNYFLQIAKIRALYLLWANVLKSYQIAGEMPFLDAHISLSSQTNASSANMIAATTQAMSAIVGGVHRLTVVPADAFTGGVSTFSQRIARNIQHILKMESHFDWVSDPAAGSYFIEKLTLDLAERAWDAFIGHKIK